MVLLACSAGLWVTRHAMPAAAQGVAITLCALSTLALVGAMIIIFEAGREASRLMALAALLCGAMAMSACLTAMLRLTADPREEP